MFTYIIISYFETSFVNPVQNSKMCIFCITIFSFVRQTRKIEKSVFGRSFNNRENGNFSFQNNNLIQKEIYMFTKKKVTKKTNLQSYEQ